MLILCREFVSDSQQKLGLLNGADDGLSDEIIDASQGLVLPDPDIGNLTEIENTMRMANNTAPGREALAKFVVTHEYIAKLVPLVQTAEDFESLQDLHRLCNIMKTIILLNDNAIMEQAVRDDLVLGVVGALECKFFFGSCCGSYCHESC
jgi:protein phosphatase-4 regulatory subunit 3